MANSLHMKQPNQEKIKNCRLPKEVHQQAKIAAAISGKKLFVWFTDAVKFALKNGK